MVVGIEDERGGIQGGVSRSTRNRGGVEVDGEAVVVLPQPQVHCQSILRCFAQVRSVDRSATQFPLARRRVIELEGE